MNVHDGTVTSGDDVLVVENDELSLELGDGVDGRLGRSEHESNVDVLVLDSTQANANVVSAHGERDLVLHLVVDGSDRDGRLFGMSVSHCELPRG